jgi:NADH-quinone oxidoreductase subunit F
MTTKIKSFDELKSVQERLKSGRDPKKPCITICVGTGCLAYGTQKLVDNFREELTKRNLADKIDFRTTGCHGFCERGPMVVIAPEKIFYQRVGLADAGEIIDKTLLKGEIIDRLCYVDPATGVKVVHEDEVPFYKKQTRLVFGMNSKVDPESLDDYLAIGGYSALGKALTGMKPEAIVQEVIKANLRGRGGGGFPAGWKWDATRKAAGEPKYVICNADEGDPGAYMDRSLLEGNPHLVLEGMIIGAFAIGSSQGYIYARNEYPLAIKNITLAIKKAREAGLLGENILGSGFSFDVKINRGGGAFVCGESSALFASLEGRAGEPRAKYTHATDKGLYDKPTNLNNVETWANVPFIIERGADWFTSIGTEGSKGTKIFSLVGKINNTGLVEVPMGTKLREIVFDIGGGIPGGTLGRLHPREVSRHGRRFRRTDQDRLDDGLRRHDRHGRGQLHGRCGQVLHQLPRQRILRQVRSLPGRGPAHAGHPARHHRGQGPGGGCGAPREDGHGHHRRIALRPGQQRPEPRLEHNPLLP